MNGTKLWMVDHAIFENKEDAEPSDTRFCGIFETEEEAINVALGISKDCFISPIDVGSMKWATPDDQGSGDSYYPYDKRQEQL